MIGARAVLWARGGQNRGFVGGVSEGNYILEGALKSPRIFRDQLIEEVPIVWTNELSKPSAQVIDLRFLGSMVRSHLFRGGRLALCALSLTCLAGFVQGQEDEADRRIEKRVETFDFGTGSKVEKGRENLISIDIKERPLKLVLEYLSQVGGINIRALSEKVERLPVTVRLENVGYRAVLDFIAKKYGLMIEQVDPKVLVVNLPEKVSMVFDRADIRDVINTIAIQADANIVVGPEIAGEISMRLENVPWHEALDIVVKTLDFVAVKDSADTIRITTPAKLEKQFETRIFRLAYLTPEGVKYTGTISSAVIKRASAKGAPDTTLLQLLKRMAGGGQFSFMRSSNALIVKNTPTTLDAIQAVINKLDIPPKQVHVSIKIVAVSDGDSERLGVNWGNGVQFNVQPVNQWSTAFPFDVSKGLSNSILGEWAVASRPVNVINKLTGAVVSATDVFDLKSAFKGGGARTPFGPAQTIALGSMGFGGTNAFFEMIRTKTNSRIVQSPQLITMDNEEATIQVGSLIRYAESFVANTEGGGNVSGFREASGSPINEGLQLFIIPHVTGPENNIIMTAIPKTEELVNFEEFAGPDGIVLRLPQTRQRIIVTKNLLRNGETAVMGGLRTDRETRNQNHVPVFSQIPIIGRLFKHRSKSVDGENLMIFITPTIVDLQLERDFQEDLDRLRQAVSKPFAPLGEEENL